MKTVFRSRACFLFAIALGAGITPARAHAEPTPQASAATPDGTVKELMARGTTEYEKEHWAAARDAFSEAFRLRRHFAVAANLGDVEIRLGLHREAAEHLEYALENLPSDRQARRTELVRMLAEASSHVERLGVVVDVAGATVRVDGTAVAITPLSGALWLAPGKHTVSVEAPGYVTAQRELAASAGGREEMRFALEAAKPETSARAAEPAAATVPPPSEPAAPPPPRSEPVHDVAPASPVRTGVIVGTGVLSAAAIAAGVVFRVQSGQASDDAASIQRSLDAASPPDVKDKQAACSANAGLAALCANLKTKLSDSVDDRNRSTIAFVAGGVLAATTVSLLFLWPAHGTEKSSASLLVPWFSPNEGAGATYRVRF